VHVGSEALLHQNRTVLIYGCQITQVNLYNGHITVVVTVAIGNILSGAAETKIHLNNYEQ